MKKLKYLLLTSSAPNSRSSRRFVERLDKRGHTVKVIHPDDFYLFLSESKGHDKIYLKSEETRVYAKEYDRVIVRVGGSSYGRYVVRHLRINIGIFVTTTDEGIELCFDKFKNAQYLSANRIKVIAQILAKEIKEENSNYLINLLKGLPVIMKILSGSQGLGVFLLESILSAGTTMEGISHFSKIVLLQRFIETKDDSERASDIRIFIVDGVVVASMKRYSKPKQYRSNYTISAMGEKYDPTDEQKELALDAAAVSKSLGVCGVDIMEDQDGINYVVEVNSNPGLKIEEVTGVNVVDKIIDFSERGKLSKGAIERYEKFDINAKVSKKGYYATGKIEQTILKKTGEKGRLFEIFNPSSGQTQFFDNTNNMIYRKNGTDFKSIDIIT